MNTTVTGTLESTEDTRASRSALETDIEVTLEWPGCVLIIEGLGHGNGTIGFRLALVLVSKTKLGQCTASGEEAGCVG